MIPINTKDSRWNLSIHTSTSSHGTVTVGNKQYYVLPANVTSSPYCDQIECGMSRSDIETGFAGGNYGLHLKPQDDSVESALLTWNDVLNSGLDGVQVWRHSSLQIRDPSALFDGKQSHFGLLHVLNCLYAEIFGDSLQCIMLLCTYYKYLTKFKQVQLWECEKAMKIGDTPVLAGEEYEKVITLIDNTFQNAISGCYHQFCSFAEPLVSRESISKLIDIYKECLPTHYNNMHTQFQFDTKEGQQQFSHLRNTGYYDRLLFYQFLAQSRVKNPQNLIHWASVTAAATYGKGYGEGSRMNASFFGSSSCVKTLLRIVEPYCTTMLDQIQNLLSKSDRIVATLDFRRLFPG